LTGLAVKLTVEPAQLVVLEAAIVTEGVTDVLTLIVIVFEFAVVEVAQASLDVSTQLTWSPFDNPLLVYVSLLVPSAPPLSIH
jgi:hypothetical protein